MASSANPLLFVNCTSRKRKPAPSFLRVDDLAAGNSAQVAAAWVSRLRRAPVRYPAAQLYCGRAVTESLRAADALRGSVHFISAGLGLVAANDMVPAYNLTVAPANPDSVLPRLSTNGSVTSSTWWSALTHALGRPRPLVAAVTASNGLVLLAVPATYLDLLAEELASLPVPAQHRLRVIGPRERDALPPFLRAQWMPYDRRLQALSGFAGTESDFPQRALHHFAVHVLPASPRGSALEHAAIVDRLLGTCHVARRVPGRRMTDDELTPIIRRLWREQNGNRSRVLRELRDTLRVACEQSRFKRLADQLEGEQRAARST